MAVPHPRVSGAIAWFRPTTPAPGARGVVFACLAAGAAAASSIGVVEGLLAALGTRGAGARDLVAAAVQAAGLAVPVGLAAGVGLAVLLAVVGVERFLGPWRLLDRVVGAWKNERLQNVCDGTAQCHASYTAKPLAIVENTGSISGVKLPIATRYSSKVGCLPSLSYW